MSLLTDTVHRHYLLEKARRYLLHTKARRSFRRIDAIALVRRTTCGSIGDEDEPQGVGFDRGKMLVFTVAAAKSAAPRARHLGRRRPTATSTGDRRADAPRAMAGTRPARGAEGSAQHSTVAKRKRTPRTTADPARLPSARWQHCADDSRSIGLLVMKNINAQGDAARFARSIFFYFVIYLDLNYVKY